MSTRPSLQRARRALFAAVLTGALAACGGADDTTAGSGATPPPPATASAAPDAASAAPDTASATTAPAGTSGVTLISPGEEPRTELRYDLTDGQRVDAELRQTQTLTQTIDGQPGLDFSITSLFDLVGDISADGDTYTMRASLENGRVADDTAPEIKEALGDSINALDGVVFVNTFDTRGHSTEAAIENAEGYSGDPSMMAMLQTMVDQNTFSAPLPAQPVGVGARWSTTHELEANGIPITQTTESELLSIDGTVVEIAVTATQEVPSGPVVLQEGLPEETQVEIEVWDMTSEGTMQADLTQPVPTSQARVAGRQEMATTVGDQTASVTQDLSTDIELTPN